MKYLLINAHDRGHRLVDTETMEEALAMIGLKRGEIDQGTLGQGVAYVVYEYGLFKPVEEQRYFRIGNTLIAGNMLMYRFDQMGNTIDLDEEFAKRAMELVVFYGSIRAIELSIAAGEVRRPQMTEGTKLLWQWPEPAPEPFAGKVF